MQSFFIRREGRAVLQQLRFVADINSSESQREVTMLGEVDPCGGASGTSRKPGGGEVRHHRRDHCRRQPRDQDRDVPGLQGRKGCRSVDHRIRNDVDGVRGWADRFYLVFQVFE